MGHVKEELFPKRNASTEPSQQIDQYTGRLILSGGQNGPQQQKAQNIIPDCLTAAAQTFTWKFHIFTPELRITNQKPSKQYVHQ